MKFLVSKLSKEPSLLLYLMGMVVVAIGCYILLDIAVHGYLFGWNMEQLHTTLYGNEALFEEPILIDSLLLQVHIDLFMTIFVLLILLSILIRFSGETKRLKWILHLLLLLGLLSPFLLLLAYFVTLFFLYVWVGAFLLWHTLAFFMVVVTLKKVWFR